MLQRNTCTFTVADGTDITSGTTAMDNGLYVATTNVTNTREQITVSGNVTIFVAEGHTLDIQRLSMAEGSTLYITGDGMLKLNSFESYEDNTTVVVKMEDFASLNVTNTINMRGAHVYIISGIMLAQGIISKDITINGGRVMLSNTLGTTDTKMTLGWTSSEDFIQADSYAGTILFADNFVLSGTNTDVTADNITGRIVPKPDNQDIAFATMPELQTIYNTDAHSYTTENILSSNYTVMDYNGNVLTKGTDYEATSSHRHGRRCYMTITGKGNYTGTWTRDYWICGTTDISNGLLYNIPSGSYEMSGTINSDPLTIYGHVIIFFKGTSEANYIKCFNMTPGSTLDLQGYGDFLIGSNLGNNDAAITIDRIGKLIVERTTTGTLTITGGENGVSIAANGGDVVLNRGITNVTRGISNANVTLGWTELADRISFGNLTDCNVSFDDGKKFLIEGTGTLATAGNISEKAIVPVYEITEIDGIDATIASKIGGKPAMLNRTFSGGQSSTVCLPFPVSSDQAAAAGTFYEFTGVDKTSSPTWTVNMQAITTGLEANTPYLFIPGGTAGADRDVMFCGIVPTGFSETSAGHADVADAAAGSWSYIGTHQAKVWDADHNTEEIGSVYGFAAQSYSAPDSDNDGNADYTVSPGDFVKVMSGASIAPFRAYLKYTAATQTRSTSDELPTTMTVRLIGTDGEVTAISHSFSPYSFSPYSSNDNWHSLDGRKLSGRPTQKGVYINNGKKVIIK